MSIVGIDHVQIAVPAASEEACRTFYLDVLGFTEIERPAATAGRSFLWVRAGDQQVHFRADPDYRAAKLAHPGFLVTDAETFARRLADAGCEVVRADAINENRFHIRDPFGNRLEFIDANAGR